MNRKIGKAIGTIGAGLLIGTLSANVMAQSATRTSVAGVPSASPGNAQQSLSPAIDATNSTIGELQQLMQSQAISELRTTYNGNYGASLLFKADSRTYYVALFQQKSFWRVVKTTSETQAEQTYKNFVSQTEKLAEVDIRRIKLEADKQYTEQLISTQEARLSALQNDLAVQRQQEQKVSVQQDQSRQQAQTLANRQQTARNQLMVLRNSIRALEAQQVNIDGSSLTDDKAKKK
ncbi:DUF2968 domain-containing protein [Glaciimonas immobilis]|uniref:DUF2968 domain-containing protein n=1 Tax=Glaciimonas immobilis TaxID=728004 RepID=A0A840RJ54_9BURK|nr:DUF2968 domain-containing protein [Glaciimonas immobilis]KAF3998832.1 DUF2968 domain-containing protein [Glaciimonas immobilis]MBB5198217.1 hypothetical protein [Glaciimonas immobilis]